MTCTITRRSFLETMAGAAAAATTALAKADRTCNEAVTF
jgi:hypothetical protein